MKSSEIAEELVLMSRRKNVKATELKYKIAAAIDQARKEAVEEVLNGPCHCESCKPEFIVRIRKEAFEKAAEIADQAYEKDASGGWGACANNLAYEIRARKSKEK